MMQPNLFILGFPKCGTSSLFNVLNQSKEITGSRPKETFFLMDSNSPVRQYAENSIGNNKTWRSFYPFPVNSTTYIMEATTHHVFQDRMLEHLQNRSKDFKLIILLREPADRIRSSFYYTKYNASYINKSITFERYVSDLLHCNPMNYINNNSSRFVLERELFYSKYIDHLRKYKSFFDEGILYIGVFEEMKNDPLKFYSNLFKWLKIDISLGELELEKKNPTYQPKSSSLQNLLASLNRSFNIIPYKSHLKKLYFKYFTDRVISSDDSLSISILKNYFEDYNKALKKEFKVDISGWK
ncbi:hypothetical protein C9994_10110 [Marivirga lumbricoides]|uniref:Sulfotransferase domain-containing protein n=1 Tax=Marivirga lumbricoides TaxID=1046115 RepID=A0A2T4DPR7_9BACT|nr:hypothetical protein C9994_10110 [Marivirga lumbricoides]